MTRRLALIRGLAERARRYRVEAALAERRAWHLRTMRLYAELAALDREGVGA